MIISQCTTENTCKTYLKKYGIFMVFLPSFINACIALAMYNDTLTLALLIRSTTSLLNCFFIMFLYISESYLKLMVLLARLTHVGSRIPIVLLSSNFTLSMTCILHSKISYQENVLRKHKNKQCIVQVKRARMNLQTPDD
jgi:hypothetical protein